MPLPPILPIISALACIYLMLNLSIATWLRFAVWFVLGIAVYVFYGRRHARLSQPESTRDEPTEAPA